MKRLSIVFLVVLLLSTYSQGQGFFKGLKNAVKDSVKITVVEKNEEVQKNQGNNIQEDKQNDSNAEMEKILQEVRKQYKNQRPERIIEDSRQYGLGLNGDEKKAIAMIQIALEECQEFYKNFERYSQGPMLDLRQCCNSMQDIISLPYATDNQKKMAKMLFDQREDIERKINKYMEEKQLVFYKDDLKDKFSGYVIDQIITNKDNLSKMKIAIDVLYEQCDKLITTPNPFNDKPQERYEEARGYLKKVLLCDFIPIDSQEKLKKLLEKIQNQEKVTANVNQQEQNVNNNLVDEGKINTKQETKQFDENNDIPVEDTKLSIEELFDKFLILKRADDIERGYKYLKLAVKKQGEVFLKSKTDEELRKNSKDLNYYMAQGNYEIREFGIKYLEKEDEIRRKIQNQAKEEEKAQRLVAMENKIKELDGKQLLQVINFYGGDLEDKKLELCLKYLEKSDYIYSKVFLIGNCLVKSNDNKIKSIKEKEDELKIRIKNFWDMCKDGDKEKFIKDLLRPCQSRDSMVSDFLQGKVENNIFNALYFLKDELLKEAANDFENRKNDPLFIFPARSICKSEIKLYKDYKSGMNKSYVAGPEYVSKNEEIVSDLGFYSSSIIIGTHDDGSKTRPLEAVNLANDHVVYVFAHKDKNDALGILVSVRVSLHSSNLNLENIVNKYAEQLKISSPKITKKLLKKIDNPFYEAELYERKCLLEDDVLKVEIQQSDIVIKNHEAYKKLDEEQKSVINLQQKNARETVQRTKVIILTDKQQENAYKALFKKAKQKEEEINKQQKNERVKEELDF